MDLRKKIQKHKQLRQSNILGGFKEGQEVLEKANHKYFKREGTPGNYKYYYTEEEYKKAKGEGKGTSKPRSSEKDQRLNLIEKLIKQGFSPEEAREKVGKVEGKETPKETKVKSALTHSEGTLKSKDGEVLNYRVYSDGGVKIESQNMRRDFKTKEDAEKWIKGEGIEESKAITPKEVASYSDSQLKGLKTKGSLNGEEGTFYNFKRDTSGRVVSSFRYSEKTESGMNRSRNGVYMNEPSIVFK